MTYFMARMSSLAFLVSASVAGCSLDGLLNSDQLPKDVSDPAITQTPTGARNAYVGTLAQFRAAFGDGTIGPSGGVPSFVAKTGLLSDELLSHSGNGVELDRRVLPEGASDVQAPSDPTYSALQKVRGQASQAIGLLTHYLPGSTALVGHLYALEGYAELFLAELYCSGVPLGTLDYAGDFTYRAGSPTDSVFAHAITLFDTALTLAGDSARVMDLARVGRGRALLELGRYTDAAAAVAGVADNYRYSVTYNNVQGTGSAVNFARIYDQNEGTLWDFTVPDQEGTNGLNWRSSGDPRTMTDSILYSDGSYIYHPANYNVDGSSSLVLASGVEARLIGAEAALQEGTGAWLTILNALRTDATFDTQPTADPNDDPTATDTLWHAGGGDVAGLDVLSDPDTDAPPGPTRPRVDLLFRERAFWLFLTGHRQGDLRRLIRQYGRSQRQVYPVGPYPLSGTVNGVVGPYGSDVTVPIPATEFANPLYTGCISRDA